MLSQAHQSCDPWLIRDPARPDIAWIEPGFAIGSRPEPPQRRLVPRHGIDSIVTLHTPDPDESNRWRALGVEFVAYPTVDWIEIPPERFDAVVASVAQRRQAGRSVLLHCIAGLNRAPTFAAAFLCRQYGLSIELALQWIRAARPSIAPTDAQIASLYEWLRGPNRAQADR